MADRIWSVSMNLDAVAADMDAYHTDEEQAAWFRGFRLGARGLPPRLGQSEAWIAGHKMGAEAYGRAATKRDMQSQRGLASAAARTAKRQPDPNHGSTAVQPDPNHGSTAAQPQTINDKRITSIEEPKPESKAAASSVAPEFLADHAQPPPPGPAGEDWFVWRQRHPRIYIGATGEDGNLHAWQSLFRRVGPAIMTVMYQHLVTNLGDRKRIGYSAALEWINRNTEETT